LANGDVWYDNKISYSAYVWPCRGPWKIYEPWNTMARNISVAVYYCIIGGYQPPLAGVVDFEFAS